jgi:hypothetical protein
MLIAAALRQFGITEKSIKKKLKKEYISSSQASFLD